MKTRLFAVAVPLAAGAATLALTLAAPLHAQAARALRAPVTRPVSAPGGAAPTMQGLVRGNAPGEWRYWGGDAHSTRYSPLDQINASNFNTLQMAWQWNAGTFGPDEYYRTRTVASSRWPRRVAV
jgi:glucose dehydrogenase